MEAALSIVPALSDDPRLVAWVTQAAEGYAHDVERVRRSLSDGKSHGFFMVDRGIAVGGMVLTTDDGYLVIEAAAGSPGRDLVHDFWPLVEQSGRESCRRGVRVETYRRGLVEKLGRIGFELQFVTMAKTF